VRILSGVFEDERTDGQRTTGTPISLMIENTDQRSKDYGEIAQAFRPATPTTPISPSTACATIAAAGAARRARRPPGWRPARWRGW
jgi:hypothetical protein